MTDSFGRRSKRARATVSPPIPESKTPSGALFMHRYAHADAAWERADFEIAREIAQVGRDVGLGAGKELIEDPQHQPVLYLLSLQLEVFRVNRLQVVRFLLRLERHHGGDAFPRHERRPGHRTIGRRLAPAGKDERAQERAHRSNAAMVGVGGEDDAAGSSSTGRILSGKWECWEVGKCRCQSDHLTTFQTSNFPCHFAYRAFNRARS